MWKWMGLFLRKNNLLRCWAWLSLLSWNGVLTLSLLLKLPPSRLEPWFALWSFFLLRLFCISINLPYSYVWNTVVIFGLVLLIATWNYWISYKKWICRTVGPSLAASLDPLAHRQNVASLSLFSIGIILADVHLNQLNWFHFIILEGGLLLILIDCMMFFTQLEPEILFPVCFNLCVVLFLVTPYLVVAFQPCLAWNESQLKKKLFRI